VLPRLVLRERRGRQDACGLRLDVGHVRLK
jgi:hypothetical protein